MWEKGKWKVICTWPVLSNIDAKPSLRHLMCVFARIISFTSANRILMFAEAEFLIISGKYNSFI